MVSLGLRAICISLAFLVYPEVLRFHNNGIKQADTPPEMCLPTPFHLPCHVCSVKFHGLTAGSEMPLLIPDWQPHHEDNPRPEANQIFE